MRKIIATSILIIAICTAFRTPKIVLTDYRDAYAGSYFCHNNCLKTDYVAKQNTNTADTITIWVSKDHTDSILDITIGSQVVQLKLVTPILIAYPQGGRYGGTFFSTDSLNFTFAQGRVSSCNYLGKKN